MNLVSNRNEKVFLCKNSKIAVSNKVDVILSPEFYWVRIFEIPVKTIKQAKEVVSTLFEDFLDTSDELSYEVLKLEDKKYLCFAYSNKQVLQEIKQTNLSLSNIKAIYFAQIECADFASFSSQNKNFFYTPEGILVKTPFLTTQNSPLELNNIKLSSNKIDLKLYNNSINSSMIYALSIVFILFSIVNFTKLLSYKNDLILIENKIEKIRDTSNLPSSMIRTNSIINSYSKKAKYEVEKREAISYLLRNKNFTLKSFSLDGDIIDLSFENSDKSKVDRYISEKYKILSSRVNALVLNVKVKL